jgi:hypothetical protein
MVPRPYLHIYTRSNELEEVGVVSLTGVNVESDPHKSSLLGVRLFYVAATNPFADSAFRGLSPSTYSHPQTLTHSLLQIPKNLRHGSIN